MSLSNILDYGIKEFKPFREFLSESFPKPKFKYNNNLIKVPSVTSSPSLVGTAFDYLLRFHLEKRYKSKVQSSTWVSQYAIDQHFKDKRYIELKSSTELDGLSRKELRQWFDDKQKFDSTVNKKAPKKFKHCQAVYNKFLSSDLKNNRQLYEACLFLARLDDVYRLGSRMKEFLIFKEDKINIEELKCLINCCNLEVFKPRRYMILNPSFGAASHLVGGADADLIVDDILIDIKVTKHLKLDRTYFNQLIGYYILYLIGGIDGRRNVEISKLGLYFARHGFLWTIDVQSIGDDKLFNKAIKILKQIIRNNAL